MPAMVETMFSVGQLPWHGLGVNLPTEAKLSIHEGLEKSGLNWEVSSYPLVTVKTAIRQSESGIPITSDVAEKAMVRSTDGSILGVVGPRFVPLQNAEAFEWFQPFLDAELCSLHTAGSLSNGQKVWILAQINKPDIEIAPGDNVSRFILLSNAHDGTRAVRVGYTPIRVVCANTLAMAHNSGNKANSLIRVRHSTQMKANLEAIREIMDVANQAFEATAEQYRWLATRHIHDGDLRRYVKIMLDADNKPDAELSTRTKNTITEIVDKIMDAYGNNNPEIRNTWWKAYNGMNAYLNHVQGRNNNNRLNSLWFGVNESVNQKALNTALEMAA